MDTPPTNDRGLMPAAKRRGTHKLSGSTDVETNLATTTAKLENALTKAT